MLGYSSKRWGRLCSRCRLDVELHPNTKKFCNTIADQKKKKLLKQDVLCFIFIKGGPILFRNSII